MKISSKHLISICFVLFFFVSPSIIVLNVYAQQQGGAASGGNAQGGAGINSGQVTCPGTCNFYGGSANTGSTLGGNTGIASNVSDLHGIKSQFHSDLNNNSNSQSGISNVKNNITAIATSDNKVSTDNAKSYSFVTKWGTAGSANGQFHGPMGITVDQSDNVYVADTGNNRIQKFDNKGLFLDNWNSSGQKLPMHAPESVSIDYLGNLYVADTDGNGILKFTSSGIHIEDYTSSGPKYVATDNLGSVYTTVGDKDVRKKLVDGPYFEPWTNYTSFKFTNGVGLAVDSNNNVYVADSGNNHIEKFSENGTLLDIWGKSGKKDGQFLSPLAVAVDQSDNVYVADTGNNRIQKFDANGNFKTKIGSAGIADGQFLFPSGVAVDSLGNVYVTDRGNNRVQVFSPSL